MTETNPRRTLRLLDLSALVLSYGLAALLIRAFYPNEGVPSGKIGVVVGFTYLWLGLAMGGPMVLLLDRRSRPADHDIDAAPRYTWAETAWLLIGGYWICLAMFVVPSRLPINPLLGVFPIVAALFLRLFARKVSPQVDSSTGWTHLAAIGVLVTWPVAWAAMILLGKTLS
ncbi:MAG: hypothetical protein JWN86_2113 [Planctomycetota bacterium]|nr:hypothetical protein [Planctomycetota bacterium]